MDSKPWTKKELTVHKDGMLALAAAVIEQWHKDGEPQNCLDNIAWWKSIIEQAETMQNN